MYAIILTGGKQVKAEVGQVLYIEKIEGNVGDEVSFDKVLYVDGDQAKVGTPFVNGASVKAKIVKIGREPKIRMIRYKAKSNLRVHRGHRQPYTAISIESINA
ncbi:MAG: 50S ribosomal protein L21 [Bacilli bacterium]|jgi:large subunit ribosomal protein L21|nr:50S ribosomal protein L21 [Bacilli bacterium]